VVRQLCGTGALPGITAVSIAVVRSTGELHSVHGAFRYHGRTSRGSLPARGEPITNPEV